MSCTKNYTSLPRTTTPEEGGVLSSEIKGFLHDCDARGLNMHSFMLVRSGAVVAECYWAPFKKDVPHTMFSFSKGITGTAVGFAVSEGLLSLDDKVSKFFPYSVKNDKYNTYNDTVTVRHLITHQSGKKISVLNNCEKHEWLENWLSAPFADAPGEKFNYLSENIYMLSRIVSKVSGQSLTEYLTPRLFEPLGIETPYWETDHNGFAAGGWGAYFKTEDMAKIGICYLNRGKYNGRQVIPEEWIDMATSRQIQKIPSVFNENTGYGFQVFIQSEEMGTFSFNGLYSQFVVMYPKYDAVFVCTAGEPQEDLFMRLLQKHFPAAFTDKIPAEAKPDEFEKLKEYIYKCEHRTPPMALRKPETEAKINGRYISMRKRGNAGVLGTGNLFMLSHRSGQIDDFSFHFSENGLKVRFKEKNSPVSEISVGLEGQYEYSEIQLSSLTVPVASYGTWLNDKSFRLTIIPISMAQYREFTFTFRADGSVGVKSVAKPGFKELFEFYLMFNGTRPGGFLKKACGVLGSAMSLVLDPNFGGRIERKHSAAG